MKVLLTSNGLANDSIKNNLEQLVSKPRKEIKIAFIPTAAFALDDNDDESKDWLVNDMYDAKEFAGYIDIVSLADESPENIIRKISFCDVIMVGGGNAFYLSYWMDRSGLAAKLPELLKTKVYVGISAGSMYASAGLKTTSQALARFEYIDSEGIDLLGPKGRSLGKSAQIAPFAFRPHYGRVDRRSINDELLQKVADTLDIPLYAVDDESAVKYVDGSIEIVGGGNWKVFNS